MEARIGLGTVLLIMSLVSFVAGLVSGVPSIMFRFEVFTFTGLLGVWTGVLGVYVTRALRDHASEMRGLKEELSRHANPEEDSPSDEATS